MNRRTTAARVVTSANNDNFENAVRVTIPTDGGTFTSAPTPNLGYSSQDPDESTVSVSSNPYLSAWWSYTPASSGTATFDTEGTTMAAGFSDTPYLDTIISVYTGGPGLADLTEVGNDDDSGTGSLSSLTLSVTGGTTYWVAVIGFHPEPDYDRMVYVLNVTGPAT